MRKMWIKLTGVITMTFFIMANQALAAAEKASNIVIVADTRKLSGWEAWFANLYNESHLYFTILTVVSIPIIGVILGLLADLIMSNIGIDLKSRELSEH